MKFEMQTRRARIFSKTKTSQRIGRSGRRNAPEREGERTRETKNGDGSWRVHTRRRSNPPSFSESPFFRLFRLWLDGTFPMQDYPTSKLKICWRPLKRHRNGKNRMEATSEDERRNQADFHCCLHGPDSNMG